jgi:hypothetical protein
MSAVKQIILALEWSLVVMFAFGMTAVTMRWAKRGGRGPAILGSTLVLLLGGGLAPEQRQQAIEEAREEKGKKRAESGDPPTDPVL